MNQAKYKEALIYAFKLHKKQVRKTTSSKRLLFIKYLLSDRIYLILNVIKNTIVKKI